MDDAQDNPAGAFLLLEIILIIIIFRSRDDDDERPFFFTFLLNNQCVTCHFTLKKLSLFLQQYDRFDRHIYEKIERKEMVTIFVLSLCFYDLGDVYIIATTWE